MTLPTCCEFHGMDECGCRQGRDCPAHKPVSYVADDGCIGYEAALLIQDERCPTPHVCNKGRAPLNWTRIGWWAAALAVIGWAAIVHWG